MASGVTYNIPAMDELQTLYNELLRRGTGPGQAAQLIAQIQAGDPNALGVKAAMEKIGFGPVQGGRREAILSQALQQQSLDMQMKLMQQQNAELQAATAAAQAMNRVPVNTPEKATFWDALLKSLGTAGGAELIKQIPELGKWAYKGIFGGDKTGEMTREEILKAWPDIYTYPRTVQDEIAAARTGVQPIETSQLAYRSEPASTNIPAPPPSTQYFPQAPAVSSYLQGTGENMPSEVYAGWYNPQAVSDYYANYVEPDDTSYYVQPDTYTYAQDQTTGAYNVPNWVTDYQATPNQMNLSTWL